MAEQLSLRLESILNFIRQEVNKKGYPPSVREIGEAVGLRSTSTVHSHLNRLEELGYIRRDPTKTRAIELIDASRPATEETIPIAIVGRVAAGVPVTAVENLEGHFPVPARYIRSGSYFLLEVRGDSMIEAGMFEQDLILVRQQEDALNGDIVVAMVNDEETTVKRFFRRDREIELVPENSAMSAFHYAYGQVKILGKVVALFREVH